ncbi:hypothetical protein FGIG_11734 [Fasciola gigantica]|uniref:Guanylate kinase-associated protein mars n=1 Tax=Fasciola gigantica TaxID=46835 RepID=A0A504YLP0_FASGI|nr:hypothetical protein FGIG_11734 [Fasciola gigantica]
MSKRVRIDLLPKTPGGRHLKRDEIFADEVEIDDEITIKSSMFRECVPGNPWFEGEDDSDENTEPPKYVVRKSVDLRRIRSLKDRVEAIRSSPMVDARPRRRYSFAEGTKNIDENDLTPLRLPNRNDLLHTTCRRLSRIVLSRSSALSSPKTNSSNELLLANHPVNTVEPKSPEVSSDISLPNVNSATPFSRGKSIIRVSMTSPSTNTQPTSTNPKKPLATVNRSNGDQTVGREPDSISDFRMLAEMQSARLNILCDDWNSVMLEEAERIPEQALDAIRATVCKCQLVLQKKMPFFLDLVEMAERFAAALVSPDPESKENQIPKTDVNDLAGYWALVADEIVRADAAFERLSVWRDEGQWQPSLKPITPARSQRKTTRRGSSTISNSNRRVPGRVLSRIPIRQITTSRSVDSSLLPSKTAKAMGKALQNSAKKSKAPVKSKFAEFLKSKRMTKKLQSSTDSSPSVIFCVHGGPISTESDSNQTAQLTPDAEKHSESFAVPQRVSTSILRRSSRSTVKRLAPASTRMADMDATADELLPGTDKIQTRVASTPITASCAADGLQFESAVRTPTSVRRQLQVSDRSSTSLSALRPGTPRPPMKTTSSSKKRVGSPLRAVLSSRKLNNPMESPFSSPSSASRHEGERRISRSVTPGRFTRSKKSISFAPNLAHTPGGHQFLSGSPRESYPLTPANNSGSLIAADRVLRRRRNATDSLTPLSVQSVSRRSRDAVGTPRLSK